MESSAQRQLHLSAVNDLSFRWYRSVTTAYWSGRVDGLEVCRVSSSGRGGVLGIGKQTAANGQPAAPVAFAHLLAGAPRRFDGTTLPQVGGAILGVVAARKVGLLRDFQPEHRFEAQVLRDVVPVPAGATPNAPRLAPVFPKRPFQFPTLWWAGGNPRYVDALMRDGSVPWVVELKGERPTGGAYYRHAISQVALYREFVRREAAVRTLFDQLNRLDAAVCRALVALPKSVSPSELACLQRLGAEFDVDVVSVNWP